MEVGDVTACPAEGDMYDCRELSIDLDALLVAEEVVIEGSAPLVGLLFGRDITISRDQVYESHMYTYTVSKDLLRAPLPRSQVPTFQHVHYTNLELLICEMVRDARENHETKDGTAFERLCICVLRFPGNY